MVKDTLEIFKEKAFRVHGDKYLYKNLIRENNRTKIVACCAEHGDFVQNTHNHLKGQGCPKCNYGSRYTKEYFIEKAKQIHGDKYDYSKVEYVNTHTAVEIICPIHGSFYQTPHNHLKGKGCLMCGGNQKLTTATFIEKARKIHGNKYDYSKVEYVNNKTKVCIICPEHGEFLQAPTDHLSGKGCLKCSNSHLEEIVREALIKNKIDFIQEANKNMFEWLNRQRLDFYLPQYNIAIECQGIQHYKPIEFFGGEKQLAEQIEKDKIKLENCVNHGVKLLYFSNIEGVSGVITKIDELVEQIKGLEKAP